MTPSRPRMSRVALAFALTIGGPSLVPPSAKATGPDPIDWRGDYARACAEAAAHGRLVWVQFTGPWCHHCQRMEREAFAHPDVIGHSSADFVPVKLRADVHEEFALGFGLSCLPATVVVRPGGEVVSRIQGYTDPESYLDFLRTAIAQNATKTPGAADPRLGLSGYCPVSLVDGHRLTAGSGAHSLEHEGLILRFASEAGLAAFRRTPARYLPALGGLSPVARVDRGEARTGSPNWGVLYDGHLYLCGDAAERARFMERPARYARVDPVTRGSCPHCWALERLIVRQEPAFPLARDRRTSPYPEAPVMEAFRARATARR